MIDLKSTLNKHPQMLENITVFRGILKDLYFDSKYKPEIYLLTKSYELGIVEEIQKNKLDNLLLKRVSKKLVNEYSINDEKAKQIVNTWCEAYGASILHKKITYNPQSIVSPPQAQNTTSKQFQLPLRQKQLKKGIILRSIILVFFCLAFAILIGLQNKKVIIQKEIGMLSYNLDEGSFVSIKDILISNKHESILQNSNGYWELVMNSKEDKIVSFTKKEKFKSIESMGAEIQGKQIGTAQIDFMLKNFKGNSSEAEYYGTINVNVKMTEAEKTLIKEETQKLKDALDMANSELSTAIANTEVDHSRFSFEEESLTNAIQQFGDKINNIQRASDISTVQQYYQSEVQQALDNFLTAYNQAIDIRQAQNNQNISTQKSSEQVDTSRKNNKPKQKNTAAPAKKAAPQNNSKPVEQKPVEKATQNTTPSPTEKAVENKQSNNQTKSKKALELPPDTEQAPPNVNPKFD